MALFRDVLRGPYPVLRPFLGVPILFVKAFLGVPICFKSCFRGSYLVQGFLGGAYPFCLRLFLLRGSYHFCTVLQWKMVGKGHLGFVV